MSDRVNVSIIVPVYNQEKYLRQCMDSIMGQTYGDFECILVDDGSKDKSPAMCDEYALKDGRVKVIHKENGGLTSARKVGFDATSGEYVCFLDSDDYLHKDFLRLTMEKAVSEDADVCTCGHFQDKEGQLIENTFTYPVPKIEKDNMISGYVLPIIGKIYAKGYLNYPGYVWGRVYRKSCITDQCFVSEREVYTEDDLFQMYLGDKLNRAVFIPDKLLYYRVNEMSLTHAYRKNMWKMLKTRHQRVLDYFKDKSLPQLEERLSASAFYAVYVTLRNAYELDKYSDFRKEISQMVGDPDSRSMINSLNTDLLRPRQKMMVFLLKNRLYIAAYYMKNALFK
jgi:glycosyltransferase involved in cell wall biosynthesis